MKHAKATGSSSIPHFKVTLDGTSELIYNDSEVTLLECLEKANHHIHYHCRDGYCGACRIGLNKGEVDYFKGEPLAYVGNNEILPCCCKPKGDIDITLL